jgi:hypothetical protein
VAYSSGLNESFSQLYEPYLKEKTKELKKFYSQSSSEAETSTSKPLFYFNARWGAFLILGASFLKKDGLTNKWLRKQQLRITEINFKMRFPSTFRKQIIEGTTKGLPLDITRRYQFLESISGMENFSEAIQERSEFTSMPIIEFTNVDKPFSEEYPLSEELLRYLQVSNLFNEGAVSFFHSLIDATSGKHPFIPLEDVNLQFVNEDGVKMPLNALSDGEFQLLVTSALIDLFDSSETFLLLDEMDAHLHSSLLKEFWENLKDVKGYLLTTSHNLTSIAETDLNKIHILENGRIESEHKKQQKIIKALSGTHFYDTVRNGLLKNIPNVVIMDGLDDWQIFKALCRKKNLDIESLEEKMFLIKKESTTKKNCEKGLKELIDPKTEYAKGIIKALGSDKGCLKTFILICDRDRYEEERNKEANYFGKAKGIPSPYEVHQFIWNRRNIESFLISKSARKHYELSEDLMNEEYSKIVEDPAYGKERVKKELMGFESDGSPLFTDSDTFETKKMTIDAKPIISLFIYDGDGNNKVLNLKKLQDYVDLMTDDEIDVNIEPMFNKLSAIINNASAKA